MSGLVGPGREKFISSHRRPIRMGVESATAGQSRRRRWAGIGAVLFVLVAGGLAAGGAALAVRRGQHQLATQAMNSYQSTVAAAIRNEVGHYADALSDVTAAIGIEPALTRADFLGLTAQFTPERLPGASGISFIVPSTDATAAADQTLWRSRGADGLTLYRTGVNAPHAFVVFSRTYSGSALPVGRDLNETPETADLLRIARETGAFTLSRAHILLRDRALPPTQQQMSFTLAVPVFGAADAEGARPLRGWVTMGVRGGDFLRATLQSVAQGAVQVSLDDPFDGTPKAIAEVTGGTVLDSPGLVRAMTLEVGNHSWRLRLRPTTRLLSTSDRWASELTLIAGVAVTVLLGILAAVLAGARNRAMDKVDEATAALRTDIKRREEVEAQLQILAYTDTLTGLANRWLFCDRVAHAISTHQRGGGQFAVFYIDLDGFKLVNDQLGHGAGDLVLREVADQLRGCLRDGDTVARLGGDEFAVLTEWLADPADVHPTADRIVEAIRPPVELGSGVYRQVTASVGVALNRPGDDADDILREADLAMYAAKTAGKCRHAVAAGAGEQI